MTEPSRLFLHSTSTMRSPTPHLVISRPSPAAVRMDARSDDELMVLARGRAESAFDELVRRHQARVLRIAARYLGNRSLAPDVAQRVFVELYHSRGRYQPTGKFGGYLAKIVLNQCRMMVRTEGRHAVATSDAPILVEEDHETILARERRLVIEAATARLSVKLREVVLLRYGAELSLEEISEVQKIPLGTVKSRLFAGLEQLRVALGDEV